MVAHRAAGQNKRHGKHQRQTRHFLRVYWPYLPLAVVLGIGLTFNVLWQTHVKPNVLAYATSMSVSELLQATNQDRAANGLGALNLNDKLDQAAQAKANDMVARNYWSHNTPDGTPPWVFITNAGYSYSSAAENLAYGFATSDYTVAGWMNSAEHKANMLNSAYSDVGFGYADSADYYGVGPTAGPETIVVAYYASPHVSLNVAAPTAASPVPPNNTTPTAVAAATQTKADNATAIPSTNVPSTKPPVASQEPATKAVSRLALVTGGKLPWIASAVSLTLVSSLAALAVRHIVALKRWWRLGERYVLHNAVFDVTIISLVGLCVVLNQSAGLFIR